MTLRLMRRVYSTQPSSIKIGSTKLELLGICNHEFERIAQYPGSACSCPYIKESVLSLLQNSCRDSMCQRSLYCHFVLLCVLLMPIDLEYNLQTRILNHSTSLPTLSCQENQKRVWATCLKNQLMRLVAPSQKCYDLEVSTQSLMERVRTCWAM